MKKKFCETLAGRWVFVRRVRTSVGVAKMNFQQLVVGRCFKPTEVVAAVDRTAICRPSVHVRDGRPITNYGYHI